MAFLSLLLLPTFACTLGQASPSNQLQPEPDSVMEESAQPATELPSLPPSGNIIYPEDLTYLGAFRLPDALGDLIIIYVSLN